MNVFKAEKRLSCSFTETQTLVKKTLNQFAGGCEGAFPALSTLGALPSCQCLGNTTLNRVGV